jgi:hypothetical protein
MFYSEVSCPVGRAEDVQYNKYRVCAFIIPDEISCNVSVSRPRLQHVDFLSRGVPR